MFERFVRQNTIESIDLRVDEKLLHITRLHLVVLLTRLLGPLIVLLICGGVALYRAMGGQFVVLDATADQQFTLFDWMLVLLLATIAATWVFTRRTAQRARQRFWLFIAGSALLLWLFFRSSGGRLFDINPYAVQTLDTLNSVLLVIALLALLAGVYIFFDWTSDQLVLTNQRVIHDHEKPWVRRVQEQLMLGDIQSVEARTRTYLEHWLNYGSIKIKSASFHRVMMFTAASDPREMQIRIMAEVKKLRKAQSEANFQRLIETRVYKDAPPRPKRGPQIQRSYTPYALSWVFAQNPEFHQEEETYIWHPHWFFLVKSLLRPTAALALALMVVLGGVMLGLLGGGVLVTLGFILLLIFVGWAAWEIEDHRNDRYILTPSQVVDIAKKPFGPESRRSAGLDALQNVTYRTTLISRLVGYGDVVLETAGPGEGLTFYDIPNPREVVALIGSYQEEFNRSQKERNLEDTLKLLRYYHTMHEHDRPGNGAQQHENEEANRVNLRPAQ